MFGLNLVILWLYIFGYINCVFPFDNLLILLALLIDLNIEQD